MIGISSSWLASRGYSIRDSIERGFELGFQLVEIGAAHKYEDNAVETVVELREKYPDRNFSIHAAFPPFKNGSYPLNLSDTKEHDRTLKIVKGMFDLGYRINAEIIGIHGGYAGELEWVEGKNGFEDLAVKNTIPARAAKKHMKVIIEDLVVTAEEKGMKFAIETNPYGPSKALMTGTEAFDWLFSTFKSKKLGMLLDIAHLHISSKRQGFDPHRFVRKFKNKIFEIHVNDVKDEQDHFAIGEGEIDFEKYLDIIGKPKLRKIPMVFEFNNIVDDKSALKSKSKIEKLLDKI